MSSRIYGLVTPSESSPVFLRTLSGEGSRDQAWDEPARPPAGASRPGPASERVGAERLALECAVLLRLGHRDAARAGVERLEVALNVSALRTPLALIPQEDLVALRELAFDGASAGAAQLFDLSIPAVLHRARAVALSEREQVVLRELMRTGKASEISEALFVSANTVKSQLRSLYRKLGVSSREEALAVAVAQRLLEPVS